MSRPSHPESPTPEDAAPAAARRRIRVADGQLQREESSHPIPPSPGGTPPPTFRHEGEPAGERHSLSLRVGLPTASPVTDSPAGTSSGSALPADITGFFRHLHDTAQALSQHIGLLTVGMPGRASATLEEARPLPMHQRRPQRVEPAKVNAKRSTRFPSPTDAPPRNPSLPGEADLPDDLVSSPGFPADERSSTDASAVADPSVPLPASVHDLCSGPGRTAFQPRQGYAEFPGEDFYSRASRVQRRWGLAAMAFCLGVTGGWLLLRVTASSDKRPPGEPNTRATGNKPADPAAVARATILVTQALRAAKSNDLARAAELFTQAEKTCPDFPGIRYQQALLALRRGEKNRSRTLLGRSLESGEEVAAVHNVQSALARLENQPQLGFAELEAATRAEPFNPKYFYFWAEALRRAGRLPEAAEKLEDALVRTNDPADESLYQLKLRLVKLDLNRENEFADDLAARLQGANVAPAEWLLTDAALALKHGEYARAATQIERARQILVPGTATFLLDDQTYRDNAWRPELAPFYPGPPLAKAPLNPEPMPAAPPTLRAQPTPAALPGPSPVPVVKPRPEN